MRDDDNDRLVAALMAVALISAAGIVAVVIGQPEPEPEPQGIPVILDDGTEFTLTTVVNGDGEEIPVENVRRCGDGN